MFDNDTYFDKIQPVSAAEALPGSEEMMPVINRHYVNDHPIVPPFPEHLQQTILGLGCFWGAERLFWHMPGVYSTAVGYAGGPTPNPNYREVCSGQTGHAEVVLVIFDPNEVSYQQLLQRFWESHDPTQGMRQGNDRGTQYRSVIFTDGEEQYQAAIASRTAYQVLLEEQGLDPITTAIQALPVFYYAEQDHQQYLAKNPAGYCGLAGTGVSCPL